MPTFCRHGRFVERCPICSKTLPGAAPARRSPSGGGSGGATGRERAARTARPRRGAGGEAVRVRRQERAAEDGYASALLPGVRASADAERLAGELSFATGRLAALRDPSASLPGPYARARSLAGGDPEQAIWICFLLAYLCPLEGPEPFASIERALQAPREQLSDLAGIEPGPRGSHDPARGEATLQAYRGWYGQAGGQVAAFVGDPGWSPSRRFERVFERLALPGLTRAARFELLVLAGALGLCPLEPDSLHLGAGRGEDQTMLAAKRLFAIGDPMLLERRGRALAEAAALPPAALELALWNWQAPARARLGFPQAVADERALQAARAALGL